MKRKYILDAGRMICKDGIAMLSLNRIGDDHTGYTLSPVDADILAHRIVNALNDMELRRVRKVRS